MTAIKELMDRIEDKQSKLDKFSVTWGLLEWVKRNVIELAKKDLEDDTYKCSDGTFLTWLLGLKVYDDLEEVIK